jgi:hypothetical protein
VPRPHIHPKSVFIDLNKVDSETADRIRREIKKRERSRKSKGRKPVDYGIAKDQFFQILDKASQPIDNKGDKGE